ncbi:M23 family metallopeptidase [Bradyrhizobium australiense]|uniref:M23 family metallopeptidase n=1 Tax=Bradyrhizobium australiense TaxID=2721161 RepID=A0A7Y4LW96_9BRAD|nr:M23 family metallopeptidase [Bradyrhizobium australiense]NOJ40904.1 M23 family metallopeptidase [Bradyrhizobium australiense]
MSRKCSVVGVAVLGALSVTPVYAGGLFDKPFDRGGALSIDKPFDKGGALSIDKPLDKGGTLSIDKPLDKGGTLSIDKPLDKGGTLSIDKPLDTGGTLSIDKPLDKGGTLSIDKPLDKGGTLSIDKPFSKGGTLSIDKVDAKTWEAIGVVAAVVVVGWAACIDGCAFVAGIVLDGATVGASGGAVAIPLVAYEFGQSGGPSQNRKSGGPPQNSTDTTSRPSENTAKGSDKDLLAPTKTYPKYYSVKDYPSPEGMANAIPKVSFKSLSDEWADALLQFSYPSPSAKPRVPTAADPAGGVFTSPRSGLTKDADSLYGKGNARRLHAATDYLVKPGTEIYATMTGTVTRIDGHTETNFPMVTIEAIDGTKSRILYVDLDPSLKKGAKVIAGETKIGTAADLSKADEYKGVPNHVHVDYTDRQGRRFDPFLNMYVDDKTSEAAAGKAD